MALKFCSLSSGSSGNCYLIKSEKTALLVDAGISGKKILNGLTDTDTDPEKLRGLLITHEHIDHVRSIGVLTKRIAGLKVFSNTATWERIREACREEAFIPFVTGEAFEIGDILVRPFPVEHDAAEPVGFSFSAEGKKACIVTDTGYITDAIYEELRSADLLVLEANHDIHTLQFCSYPYNVKRRILGDKGHLSNDAAAEVLCRILQEEAQRSRQRTVVLAHLSKENNFPEMAYQTVRNLLEEKKLHIGGELKLEILLRDSMSKIFSV